MKTLKDIMQESPGFRFVIGELKMLSPAGRSRLLQQPFWVSENEIQAELDLVDKLSPMLEKTDFSALSQLRDIHGTLSRLADGVALDDIELFEIKHVAILSGQLRQACASAIGIPALEEVVRILDPEGQGIPHFYIYSAYSPQLAEVRRLIKTGVEELREKEQELEAAIREDLSQQLLPWSDALQNALAALAHLDVLQAKARQALEMGMSKPAISRRETRYEGLFNPAVKAFLEKENKHYQPVDIALQEAPVLVTGANMGGKTVLLKTLYLAQCLFQTGFFVPARAAAIAPVEEVMLSQTENQAEWNGLSSFAWEMTRLGRIIAAVRQGKSILALIDELARTTSPGEGQAIVQATLDILQEKGVRAVVTTHYTGIESPCRKLRIKGLKTDQIEGRIRFEQLNELMDYSLVEAEQAGGASEAFRIAEIIGIDAELIEKAKKYFSICPN
jgi:dsDNA-specific endonuclease/ATPase MutS2